MASTRTSYPLEKVNTLSHIFFRKLIFGNQQDVNEFSDSKMTMLRGQFALVAMAVGLTYAIIVMLQGEFNFIPWHILLIGGSGLSFYLNRIGKHLASTLLIFTLCNAFVYLVLFCRDGHKMVCSSFSLLPTPCRLCYWATATNG
jgi:hypothetical protein